MLMVGGADSVGDVAWWRGLVTWLGGVAWWWLAMVLMVQYSWWLLIDADGHPSIYN